MSSEQQPQATAPATATGEQGVDELARLRKENESLKAELAELRTELAASEKEYRRLIHYYNHLDDES